MKKLTLILFYSSVAFNQPVSPSSPNFLSGTGSNDNGLADTKKQDMFGNTSDAVTSRDEKPVTNIGEKSDSDSEVSQRIRNVLNRDPRFSAVARRVQIKTANEVVTLSGMVATAKESQLIESKVRTVVGVKNVRNQIQIIRN